MTRINLIPPTELMDQQANEEGWNCPNAEYSLALPDQSANVINRIKAQGMREAADLHNSDDVLAPVGNSSWGEARQEGWIEGTAVYRDAILARAAELEKS